MTMGPMTMRTRSKLPKHQASLSVVINPDVGSHADVGVMIPTRADADSFLADFSLAKKGSTLRGYLSDLRSFAQFTANGDVTEAVRQLLGSGPGAANRLVHLYRAHLLDRKLSPNSINRHLTSACSVVGFANWIGLVPWRLKVQRLPARRIKDVRGPGVEGVRSMLHTAEGYPNLVKGIRDTAILWLLFGCAMRVGEIVSLNLEHVDSRKHHIFVLGKGCYDRTPITVPPPAMAALLHWLAVRHQGPGPVFHRLDAHHHGKALTKRGIFKMVRLHSGLCGFITRPHGLRHAAISDAFDHGLPLRDIKAFSRHKSADALAAYDDALQQDVGAKIAKIVSADITSKTA